MPHDKAHRKDARRARRRSLFVGLGLGSVLASAWWWVDHVGLVFIGLESFVLAGLLPEVPYGILSVMGLATLGALLVVLLNWAADKLVGAERR